MSSQAAVVLALRRSNILMGSVHYRTMPLVKHSSVPCPFSSNETSQSSQATASNALNDPTWTIPTLPPSVDLPGTSQQFSLHGQSIYARFPPHRTSPAELLHEAQVLKAVGPHANILQFLDAKTINGCGGLAFLEHDCVALEAVGNALCRSHPKPTDLLHSGDRLILLRHFACGLLGGLDAVRNAGFLCPTLGPQDLLIDASSLHVKLANLGGATGATAIAAASAARTMGAPASGAAHEGAAAAAILRRLNEILAPFSQQQGATHRSQAPLEQKTFEDLVAALEEPCGPQSRSLAGILSSHRFLALPPPQHTLDRIKTALSQALDEARHGLARHDSDSHDVYVDARQPPLSEPSFAHPRLRSVSSSSEELDIFYDASDMPPKESSPANAGAVMIANVANRVLMRVATSMLARFAGVQEMHNALRAIHACDAGAAAKLQAMVDLLEQHRHELAQPLQQYADAAAAWLSPLAKALADMSAQSSPLARAKQIVQVVEDAVRRPAARQFLSAESARNVQAMLGVAKNGIGTLDQFSRLGEGASFADYLQVPLANSAFRDFVGPQVQGWLAQAHAAFDAAHRMTASLPPGISLPPIRGSLSDHLAWLTLTLSKPGVMRALQPYLPEGSAQALGALARVNEFPLQGTLSAQSRWLLSQVQHPDAHDALKGFAERFGAALTTDANTLALVRTFASVTDSRVSYREKAEILLAALARSMSLGRVLDLAHPLISNLPGGSPVLSALRPAVDWYAKLDPGLSWREASVQFARHASSEALKHPDLMVRLVPVPGIHSALEAAHAYRAMPAGMSWRQTFEWAVGNAARHPAVKSYYDTCTTALLMWKLAAVFRGPSNIAQQEAALREISESLRSCLSSSSSYPGLDKFADLLPYLPAIAHIAPQCRQLFAKGATADWLEGLIEIVFHSPSPELQRLRTRLQSHLEDGVSDGLVQGLEAIAGAIAGTVTEGLSRMAEAGGDAWRRVGALKDPLSLQFMVAEASSLAPTLPLRDQMQQYHAQLLSQGLDDEAAQEHTRKHFSTTTPVLRSTKPLENSSVQTLAPQGYVSELSDEEFNRAMADFDPFKHKTAPLAAAQIAGAAAVATSWIATAFLAYQTFSKPPRRDPASATQAPSDSVAVFDPISGRVSAQLQDNVSTADNASAITRYAKPIALASMVAISSGATYALAKAIDSATELEASPPLESSPFLEELTETAASGRARRTEWSASIKQRFEFEKNYPSNPHHDRLETAFRNALANTLAANVRPENRILHLLIQFDLQLKNSQLPILPDHPPTASVSVSSAITSFVRDQGRRLFAEYSAPSLHRTAGTAAPVMEPLDPNGAKLSEALELEAMILPPYQYQLGQHYEKVARTRPLPTAPPLTIERTVLIPDLNGMLERVVIGAEEVPAPLPTHPPLVTEQPPQNFRPGVLRMLECAIAAVDEKFCNFAIRQIENSNRTPDGIRDQVFAEFKLIRWNLAREISRAREEEATGITELLQERIGVAQMSKYHATAMFNNFAQFFEMLRHIDPEMLSSQLPAARALVQAKVEAARLTLMRFAPTAETLTGSELMNAYTLLQDEGPEIVSHLRNAASLTYALLTGNTHPSVRTLAKRKTDGIDGNLALSDEQQHEYLDDPDKFFPWRPRMMKLFSEADHSHNPINRLLDPDPPGYTGIESFKRSNQFSTWRQYYQQFNKYADSHVEIQAKKFSYLSLLDAGLDQYTCSLPVINAHVLELAFSKGNFSEGIHTAKTGTPEAPLQRVPGLIGVIQLLNGDVLVTSSVQGRALAKLFPREIAIANRTLMHIVGDRPLTHRATSNWYGSDGGFTGADLLGANLVRNFINPIWTSFAEGPASGIQDYGALVKRRNKTYALETNRKSLLNISDELMKEGLIDVSNAAKEANFDETAWHSIATNFIPFYSICFRKLYDSEYTASKTEIFLNLLTVAAVLVPTGINLAKLSNAAWHTIRGSVAAGIRGGKSGKDLVKWVVAELAKKPEFAVPFVGQSARLIGGAAVDLVSPIPLRTLLKPLAIRTFRGTDSAAFIPSSSGRQATAEAARSITLNKKTIGLSPSMIDNSLINPIAFRSIAADVVAITRARARVLKPITYSWWSAPRAPGVVRPTIVQSGRVEVLRSAAKHLMYQPTHGGTGADRAFVRSLLERSNDMRGSQRADFAGLITSNMAHDFISEPHMVNFPEQLSRIEPGKLLAFISPDRQVQHVMVSIGGGWFAGENNHVVRETFGPERRFILAEEFGDFSPNSLINGNLSMATGYPVGAAVRRENLSNQLATTRIEQILGSDVGQFYAIDGKVAVRAHGAPFITNFMDGVELGNIVQGLTKKSGMAGPIQEIKLVVCWSASSITTSNISTGQVLADYLNVPVIAYKGNVTLEEAAKTISPIRKVFSPRLAKFDAIPNLTPAELREKATLEVEILKDRQRHMKWADASQTFINMISALRTRPTPRRHPRNAEAAASRNDVEKSVLQFVLGKTSADVFLQTNSISVAEAHFTFPFLADVEAQSANFTDDERLAVCVAIMSSKSEWVKLVED